MSERHERFERNLARYVSDLIPSLKDPRIPMIVTVEQVRIKPDLSAAKVLVSSLGDEQEKKEMCDALNHASGHLQREIGKELHSKKTPKLSFTTDPSEVLYR